MGRTDTSMHSRTIILHNIQSLPAHFDDLTIVEI